jgi:hypothetical protein
MPRGLARRSTVLRRGCRELRPSSKDWRPSPRRSRSVALAVIRARRPLPHNLFAFVDLESRLLQVLHDPLGKHLPGIVRRVLLEEPAQEIAAPGHCEAD